MNIDKKIMVLANKYLANACCRELKQLGVDAFSGELKFPDTVEMLAKHRPDAVFSINFHPQLAHVLRQLKIKYIAWCVDTVGNDRVFELCTQNRCGCYVFSYDLNDCKRFKQAGFEHVMHLCLAPDAQVFTPATGNKADAFEADVGFVGSSLFDEAKYLKNFIRNVFFVTKQPDPPSVKCITDKIFDVVGKDPYAYSPNDLLKLIVPCIGGNLVAPAGMQFGDVLSLVDKTFSSILRHKCLQKIEPDCGLKVWGDAGWRNVLDENTCCGVVEYPLALCPVYRKCRINLHFSKFSQGSCVPLRVLEIAASGGFVLASKTEMITREFEEGQDIEVFANAQELAQKVEYYLAHPEKRALIAEKGCAKVRTYADLNARMKDILSVVFGE